MPDIITCTGIHTSVSDGGAGSGDIGEVDIGAFKGELSLSEEGPLTGHL